MKYFALAAALALSACGTPNFNNMNASVIAGTAVTWTYDTVRRDPQYLQKDIDAKCFAQRGIPLRDRSGCVVAGRKVCVYITKPNDNHALREMNAICNGYRPMPRLL